MAEMKGLSSDAYDWLVKKDPTMWSKSHFSTRSKCDLLLNNYSESFNKIILETRDKPILTMMEIICTKMMQRISKKAEASQKYTGLLCPKIQKQVDISIKQAVRCWPTHAGGLIYEVAFGRFDQHVVDLELRECSCRKWALTGLPCVHAVSAILLREERSESYVDPFYHRSTQINIYSNIIYPIKRANQWETVPSMEPTLPPIQRRPPGRPKKERRKGVDEQENNSTRGQRTLKIKCKNYGKSGHNIRTCKGQVGGNYGLNTPLATSPTSASQNTPPVSGLAPPASQNAPPTSGLVLATVPPSTSTTRPPKFSCRRPTTIKQVLSQPVSQFATSL